jgi:hypothetical protein
MARSKEMLPIGTNKEYDRKYDRLRLESPYLNSSNVQYVQINLTDESCLKYEKTVLQTRITMLEEELIKIEEQFSIFQQKRVNSGFNRPDQMTPEQKRYKLETRAAIDVHFEEVADVERRLKKFADDRVQLRKPTILPRGLQQHYHLNHDKILEEIDGQRCGVIKGVVCICDELSPYDGMPVVEYRRLADQWHKEYTERINENDRRRDEAILNHKEAQFLGKYPPIPKWPEGVKSMKQKDKATA